MKDKRNLLKIACLIEIIYVVLSSIYIIIYSKTKDEVISTIFFNLINVFFTIILYKESTKDEKYLKNNKVKIKLCGIWFFITSIVPGILCFLYLRSFKEKKKDNLPTIKKEPLNKIDVIKSVLLIIIFAVIMFVFPKFIFFNKIPGYITYIIIFLIVVFFNYKYLIKDFIVFKNNIKKYFPFIIKRYLYMLLIMIIVAIPIILINKGDTSNNQKLINEMFEKVPIVTLLLSTLYAPFVEENIFRLSLSKLINNKYLFIIISGLIFGILHVFDKSSSFKDYLYIFQYSVIGICLAKSYYDSNNIFVSISMHFIQNFLAAILILIIL